MSESIDTILQLPQRKLVVADSEVHLDSKQTKNEIYVLMVEESRGSAGGRAAGSGHRRINKIYGFLSDNGVDTRFFETTEPDTVDRFEIPFSAVAMDIRLSDGRTYVVQGVVDPNLVASYRSLINSLK
jgi:hypothetical protein